MLSKIAKISSFATATLAAETQINKDELSRLTMDEFTQFYDANAMKRQSPININTDDKSFPTVSQDEALTTKFASKVSYKNVNMIHGSSFNFGLVGDDMEFTTSMSQWWFPETDPITFTPAQFHFHKGNGERNGKSDNGSEHTYNGNHMNLEMHIVNLNLDKSTQDKFLAAVIGIVFNAECDEDHEENFADRFFKKLFHDEPVDFNEEFFQYINMGQRFVYRGSLTTPPYSEPLLWNMVEKVVPISKKTLHYFGQDKKVIKEYNPDGGKVQFGGDNRKPMPVNGRQIIRVDIQEQTTAAFDSDVTYFTQEKDENLYAQKLDLLKAYLTQM